jgi:hypothetical protein
MSGALAQYRTPSRPVFNEIEIDNPEFVEGGDAPEKLTVQLPVPHPTKMQLVPIPIGWDNEGKPIAWHSVEVPAQKHVLDYRPQAADFGKHSKGRAPKLTNEQRRRRGTKAERLLRARQAATHKRNQELTELALDAAAIEEALRG